MSFASALGSITALYILLAVFAPEWLTVFNPIVGYLLTGFALTLRSVYVALALIEDAPCHPSVLSPTR